MTLVSTPARTSGDLGAALSNTRAPVSNELSAVHVEKIKDHLIEIAAALNTAVGDSDGSVSGSLNERVTSFGQDAVRIVQDWRAIDTGGSGWRFTPASGGSVVYIASGIKSFAPATPILSVDTTPGASVVGTNRALALALDATHQISRTWRMRVQLTTGAIEDDQCDWVIGHSAADGSDTGISVNASWDPDTMARSYALDVRIAGVSHAVSIPSWPTYTGYLDLRITATASGAVLEAAADGGVFSTLVTSTQAPRQINYLSYVSISRSNGAGNRALMLGYLEDVGTLAASADLSGAIPREVPTPMTDAEHAKLAALPTAVVPTSRQITAGTGLSGGGDLSADRSFAVVYGTNGSSACAGNDARLSDSRTPTGSAGGDLTGTYPSPTIAALAVTDAKVATANKDGASATPSMRTLGTGAAQACAGNDARLSDSRSPTAHASSHVTGGSDVIASAVAGGNAGLMTGADKTKIDGLDVAVRSRKTASFAADVAVGIYLVDTSSGNVVITLPAVVEHGWVIKKTTTDTNTITITPNGTDNIEGANSSLSLQFSGTTSRGAWQVFGSTQASALGWWVC